MDLSYQNTQENLSNEDNKYEQFFVSMDSINDDYVYYNNIFCRVASTPINNNKIIIKPYKQTHKNFRYSDIGIYQLDNNNKYKRIAIFYNHFHYTSGFRMLLNDLSFADNIKIVIINENLDCGHIFTLDIRVYLKRNFLSTCLDINHIPKLLHQMLLDDYEEIPLYNELTTTNIKYNSHSIDFSNYLREPFHYQKDNIQWLIDQETKIANNQLLFNSFVLPTISGYGTNKHYLHYIKPTQDYILVDSDSKLVNLELLPQMSFNIRGGVIADDIGLGKTFSALGLIYQTVQENSPPTLIICPNRLCKQWQEEITKTCPLKSKIISSITQFKKLTFDSIASYDTIIVSYNFIISLKYNQLIEDNPNLNTLLHKYHWKRIILDEAHEFIHKNSHKKKRTTLIRDYINTIPSNYKWICSGTPYASYTDSWHMISYICNIDIDISIKDLYYYKHIYDKLIVNIFRKNTKDSVKEQVSIPSPNIKVDFLDMSLIERNIYDSALNDNKKKVELCNHILVSDEHINILGNKPLPLTEIHAKMTTYYNKKISKYQKLLDKLENKHLKYLKSINSLPNNTIIDNNNSDLSDSDEDDDDNENITGNNNSIILDNDPVINDYLEDKKKYNDMVQLYTSKFNIFDSLDSKLKENETCPVCLEELNTLTKTITPCGHFFCAGCIQGILKNQNKYGKQGIKCPSCRQDFNTNELKIIKVPKQENIEQLGTKLTTLIQYLNSKLNENSDNRIIVFSQWDSMLKMISKILLEKNLNHIFLDGSIHVVNSRIRKFKLDPNIRIVLLSSDKASSGLNLTETTDIVLLDTMNHEDKNVVRVIEEQAIGRAVRIGQTKQVQVQRFIMRNSIEHDYYLQNNYHY